MRNKHIRGMRVAQAFKKINEGRLNWYGHMFRRDEEPIPRKVPRTDIPGKRERTTENIISHTGDTV